MRKLPSFLSGISLCLLLSHCSTTTDCYLIQMNDGRDFHAIDRPALNQTNGYYVYTDRTGKNQTIRSDEVTSIIRQ